MRFFNKLKSTPKVLFAAASTMFFVLSSPVKANELSVDTLLNNMINSAVEATTNQVVDAIEQTLESKALFEAVEASEIDTLALNSNPVLPVDTTAAE